VRDVLGQEVVLELANRVILDLMTPESHKTALPLLVPGNTWTTKGDWGGPQEGDRVLIDYVSADIHIGVCMRMAIKDTAVRRLRPLIITCRQSDVTLPDPIEQLGDSNMESTYAVERSGKGKTDVELDVSFAKPQTVDGLGLWADGVWRLQLHTEVDDKPKLLYSGPAHHTIRFPSVETERLTLTLTTGGNIKIKELKLTQNPRRTPGDKWVRY
jgi:hypothetical protein